SYSTTTDAWSAIAILNENPEIYEYLENNVANPTDSCPQQEDMEFAMELIDIMDDGMVNGEYVFVGPHIPIYDMEAYLDCFDTSQGATITLYVDQPITNNTILFSPTDGVGHTFVSIT